jgi:positive regulator of sigma E activity
MEIETGTVIGVTEGKALVQVQMGEPCAGCAAHRPCSAMGSGFRQIEADNRLGAAVGDRVQIDCPPQSRVVSAAVLFFFPIVLALVGYFVGYSVQPTEGGGIVGTFAGLILAFVTIWFLNPILAKRQRLPAVRRVEH